MTPPAPLQRPTFCLTQTALEKYLTFRAMLMMVFIKMIAIITTLEKSHRTVGEDGFTNL